jgi:heptosyltransferase-1
MKRIAILRRTAFGDIIHTLPAIAAIKKRYPDVQITWITEKGYGKFLQSVPLVDSIIEIGFRSMTRSHGIKGYLGNLRDLTSHRFDVLLDFQGTLKSWLLLKLAKAERKIGFHHSDTREPLVTSFYTEELEPINEAIHVVEKNLRLLRSIGIATTEIAWPQFEIDSNSDKQINDWQSQNELENFLLINPFTTWKTKNWPLANVSDFCLQAQQELGLQPVILWGPGEKEAAEEIASSSGGKAVIAPRTDFVQLIALLRKSSLYIGGDTGPSHLAAALGVPVVALFGPTDPKRNGPVDNRDQVVKPLLCKEKCSRNKCPLDESSPKCMAQITTELVVEAAKTRLKNS